jgi:four helix bundle protein
MLEGESLKEKGESKESKGLAENDLTERLFRFAINVIKMLRKLKGGSELLIIKPQLIKSASSSGANYEEAQGAVSRADFGNKVGISLKEMRESNCWLKILRELFPENTEIEIQFRESIELKCILGSIHSKVSKRIK